MRKLTDEVIRDKIFSPETGDSLKNQLVSYKIRLMYPTPENVALWRQYASSGEIKHNDKTVTLNKMQRY